MNREGVGCDAGVEVSEGVVAEVDVLLTKVEGADVADIFRNVASVVVEQIPGIVGTGDTFAAI